MPLFCFLGNTNCVNANGVMSLSLANLDDLRRGVINIAVMPIDKVGKDDGLENLIVDVLCPALASLFLDFTTVATRCTAGYIVSSEEDEIIYRFLVGCGGGNGRLRRINVFVFRSRSLLFSNASVTLAFMGFFCVRRAE